MREYGLERTEISIHTPAKGVTQKAQYRVSPVNKISIHTPAKGVTGEEWIVVNDPTISIHTPAKGVTAILPNFRLYIL